MKKFLLFVLSFLIIFNCNSICYANDFTGATGFNLNLVSFSFDNNGIKYQNNIENKFMDGEPGASILNTNNLYQRNEFAEYSSQFGIGLAAGFLAGVSGFFLGLWTGGLITDASRPKNQPIIGMSILPGFMAIIFSITLFSISSALGINISTSQFFSREGNICRTILIGIISSVFLAINFGFLGLYVGDFTKQYIATFILGSLVTLSQVITINLSSNELQKEPSDIKVDSN